MHFYLCVKYGSSYFSRVCTSAMVTFVLGGSLCLWSCEHDKNISFGSTPADSGKVIQVETVAIQRWHKNTGQSYAGVVRPGKRASLSTRMHGTLTRLHVHAGDMVKQGTLLAQVDARDTRAALDAAHKQLGAAQSAYAKASLDAKRLERLYAEDLIARNRLEQVLVETKMQKAALEQARANVLLQQTNLEYADISAPFSGIVSETLVDEGTFVGPGTALLILEDRSTLRIDVPIPTHMARTIAPATMAFRIKAFQFDGMLTARYQATVPSMGGNGTGQTLRLVLESSEDTLLPGQVVEVIVTCKPFHDRAIQSPKDKTPSFALPRSALIRQGQLTSVLVAENEDEKPDRFRLKKRWIMIASSPAEHLESDTQNSADVVRVIQGLAAGEQVVVNPSPALSDGQIVSRTTRNPRWSN